jgi:hypothetical protein
MSEIILNIVLLIIWRLGLSSNQYSRAKQEIIERI